MLVLCGVALVATSIALWGAPQQKPKPGQGAPPKGAVKQTPKPPPPKKDKEQQTSVVKKDETTPGAPDIVLSVNCLQESVGIEGKPILIEASINADSEDDKIAVVELSKPGGFWGELLAIQIRNNRGEVVAGTTPKLASKGGASITLDGKKFGWLVWTLDTKLAPGTYSLNALLDTKTATAGWKGKTKSPPAVLVVKPASAALSEDEIRLVLLSEVRGFAALGKAAEALAACDRHLTGKPMDALILEEKGDLLLRTGRAKEALQAYNAAIEIEPPVIPDAIVEPPFELLRKRAEAAAELAKGG
jgi:hypothetical protein